MPNSSFIFLKKPILCENGDFWLIVSPLTALCITESKIGPELLYLSTEKGLNFTFGSCLYNFVKFLVSAAEKDNTEDFVSECKNIKGVQIKFEPPLILNSGIKLQKKNEDGNFKDYFILSKSRLIKSLLKNIYDFILQGLWNNILTQDIAKDFITKFQDTYKSKDIGQFDFFPPWERLQLVDNTLVPFRKLPNQHFFEDLYNVHYYHREFQKRLTDLISFQTLSSYLSYIREIPKKSKKYKYPWHMPSLSSSKNILQPDSNVPEDILARRNAEEK